MIKYTHSIYFLTKNEENTGLTKIRLLKSNQTTKPKLSPRILGFLVTSFQNLLGEFWKS